jgi:glycosyltransferase involved in cell wall biosynthesis
MNSENSTRISVIIPVFNGQRYLSEAITSVLSQTYAPLEIIVVDDGSTDATAEIVRRFGPAVQYHHQANQGPAVARNLGVLIASGEMLAFLDADDFWHVEKISKQVSLLVAQGDGYVTCHFHPILENGLDWPQSFNRSHYESNPVCALPSGLLLTRTTWERIGPFNNLTAGGATI